MTLTDNNTTQQTAIAIIAGAAAHLDASQTELRIVATKAQRRRHRRVAIGSLDETTAVVAGTAAQISNS